MSSSEGIRKVLHEEETDDRTDVVGVVHETQAVVVRVIEVSGPSIHLLRGVHHHASITSQRNP